MKNYSPTQNREQSLYHPRISHMGWRGSVIIPSVTAAADVFPVVMVAAVLITLVLLTHFHPGGDTAETDAGTLHIGAAISSSAGLHHTEPPAGLRVSRAQTCGPNGAQSHSAGTTTCHRPATAVHSITVSLLLLLMQCFQNLNLVKVLKKECLAII